MLNSTHKKAYLEALDGVDHEIDKLTLGSKTHTANARSAMGANPSGRTGVGEEAPEHEAGESDMLEKGEHELAGVDPHTGERSSDKTHYQKGQQYDGKGQPGGHTEHPFGQRGASDPRKPLFGKRFAR